MISPCLKTFQSFATEKKESEKIKERNFDENISKNRHNILNKPHGRISYDEHNKGGHCIGMRSKDPRW